MKTLQPPHNPCTQHSFCLINCCALSIGAFGALENLIMSIKLYMYRASSIASRRRPASTKYVHRAQLDLVRLVDLAGDVAVEAAEAVAVLASSSDSDSSSSSSPSAEGSRPNALSWFRSEMTANRS